ncbi:MAG: hypothetical protein U1E80_10970 [Piscinibacter sp.]
MNYVKRDDTKGTSTRATAWQIRTFWWSLLWAVVGFITMFVLVGFVILAADAVWTIYRIVKVFELNDGKPMAVRGHVHERRSQLHLLQDRGRADPGLQGPRG